MVRRTIEERMHGLLQGSVSSASGDVSSASGETSDASSGSDETSFTIGQFSGARAPAAAVKRSFLTCIIFHCIIMYILYSCTVPPITCDHSLYHFTAQPVLK